MQESALIIFELRQPLCLSISGRRSIFIWMQRRGAHPAGYHLFRIHSLGSCAAPEPLLFTKPRYTLFEERYVKWLEIICSRAKECGTCAGITTSANVIFVRQGWSNRTTCRDVGKARAIRRSVCDLAQLQSRDSVDLARSGGGLRKGVGRHRYHLWTHPPTGLCLVADDSRRLVLGIH